MKKLLLTLLVSTLGLGLVHAKPNLPPQAKGKGGDRGPTIVGVATGNPDFSTLVAAVVKADLVDTLDGRRQFTVFAPDNDAFDAAAAAVLGAGATGPELVDALPAGVLEDILLYHIAPGNRSANAVVPAERIRTVSKGFLLKESGGTLLSGVGSSANIIDTNIDASNGVIHVIDFVLLPFVP